MSIKDEIAKGIGVHGMWKQRLLSAITTGTSEWKPEIVCQDNQCEFGKWLYACAPHDKLAVHYKEVKTLHADFHKEAAGVLKLALAGKKKEAETAVGIGGKYKSVSTALTKEMMAWKDSL